ncbi:hypothetical protein KVV02_000116 [Mortierella alpina]|uniref:DM2 domain-containing protein n=1 Tax=Mortierella alpina TaxID=64518 RepID=A0A9P8D0A4_MORAP|nr:hypothetical protein KVV02_000116 [Mortierella alpina]
MSVEIYRPKVTELISKADITTVSARSIRKQIEAITKSSLDHVKRDFDEMVMEIYEKITDDIERAVLNGTQAPSVQQHQQQHQHQHQQQPPQTGFVSGFALPPTSYVPPPPPPPAPAPAQVTSDESEDDDSDSDASEASYSSLDEETGRKRKKPQLVKDKAAKAVSQKKRDAQAKARAKKLKDKAKKVKEEEKEMKAKKKRKQPMNEDGTPKVNPFNRPMVISDKLAEVVGQAGSIGPSGRIEMSRPEVVKQLWVYIKANSLQLENDKRVIACDEKLKTLFGQEQVNCFSMNKYLSSHLSKAEELV